MTNFIPEQEKYKKLTPFKLAVLQNFPYIEEDFDALTNYGLMCKIVEYLNNVIANENAVESNVSSLYNAFVSLQDYVNSYFDNLDVQEEINSKLDRMAEDGTLYNIIERFTNPIIQEQNNNIAEIQHTVDAITSNTPIFVDSTSEMLDNTKVYVLTSNGHIYYYSTSSSSFVDSGITYASNLQNYLGFKGSLDDNNDVNVLVNNGFYGVGGSTPAHWPISGVAGLILNYYISEYRHYQVVYLYNDENSVYVRHQQGNVWSNWTNANKLNTLYNIKDTTITDLNNDNIPGYMFLKTSDNISNKPYHTGVLINYVDTEQQGTRHYQTVYAYDGNVYVRNTTNGVWTDWKILNTYNGYQITNGKNLIIDSKGIKFVFQRTTDSSINLDTYRLTRVYYDNNYDINPIGGDIEGPVRELNANDYVSGVHGNEQYTNLKLIVDGKEIDLSTATPGNYTYNSIQIFVESNVYSIGGTSKLATRYVSIDFTDKVRISQSWKFAKNCSLERACCGGLFSSMDSSLNGYVDGVDYKYNSIDDVSQGIIKLDERMKTFKFITKFNKSIIVRTLSENTTGLIEDYAPGRLKNYFFNIYDDTGVSFNTNDVMSASFEIEII